MKTWFCAFLLAAVVTGCNGSKGATAPSGNGQTGPSTYYVAPNGNDGGGGTIEAPWRTISRALQRLVPGDTVLVRGGTYHDAINNPAIAGASWDQPIRIAAYPGETVWLAPPAGSLYAIYLAASQHHIEFDGINVDAQVGRTSPVKIEGWSGGNAHHIRIKNAEIVNGADGIPNQGTNGGAHAIIATAAASGIIGGNEFQRLRIHGGGDPGDFAYGFYIQSNDNLIEECEITDTSGGGIQIYNGSGYPPTGNVVRGNRIHDIRRSADARIWGIVDAADRSQIRNNTIFGVGVPNGTGAAIDLYYGNGAIIDGNTIYENHPLGIYIESGVRNAVVTNNAVYGNGTDVLDRGVETHFSDNTLSSGRTSVAPR